jgi:hypothetical protein
MILGTFVNLISEGEMENVLSVCGKQTHTPERSKEDEM